VLPPQPEEAALRLAADIFFSGRWLYADFAYDYPPVVPVLLGLPVKLLGLPLEATRILCSLLLALALILTYEVARRVTGVAAAVAALCLLVFDQGFHIYHGGADGRAVATLLATASVWLFLRRSDRPQDAILAIFVAFLAGFAHLAVMPLPVLLLAAAIYGPGTGRERALISIGSLLAIAVTVFLLVRDWPAFRFEVLEDGPSLIEGWRHLQPLLVIAALVVLRLTWLRISVVAAWLAVFAYPGSLVESWRSDGANALPHLKTIATAIAAHSKPREHVLTSHGHLALLAGRDLAPGLGKQASALRPDWPEPRAIRYAMVTVGMLEHYLRRSIPEIVVVSDDSDNPFQFRNAGSYGARVIPLLERNYHSIAVFPAAAAGIPAITVFRKNEGSSESAVGSELQ
jgi:hypothetical protein